MSLVEELSRELKYKVVKINCSSNASGSNKNIEILARILFAGR
jgi:hypothetical protein